MRGPGDHKGLAIAILDGHRQDGGHEDGAHHDEHADPEHTMKEAVSELMHGVESGDEQMVHDALYAFFCAAEKLPHEENEDGEPADDGAEGYAHGGMMHHGHDGHSKY